MSIEKNVKPLGSEENNQEKWEPRGDRGMNDINKRQHPFYHFSNFPLSPKRF
jgi:hypothetical protein